MYTYSIFLLLLTGSLTAATENCSENDWYKCFPSSFSDYCLLSRNGATCMEKILQNCTNDELIEKVSENLAHHRAMAEQCPGLPDGECFMSSLIRCEKKVPFNVAHQTNLRPEDKKSMCFEFKGRPEGIRACMKLLKTFCPSPRAIKAVDASLQVVDDIIKKCANEDV